MRGEEQNIYKPSAEPQTLLISLDKEGYKEQGDGLCVWGGWVIVFFEKQEVKRR